MIPESHFLCGSVTGTGDCTIHIIHDLPISFDITYADET